MAPLVPPDPLMTTFLVANIHCPTCVSSIKDALQELGGVRWVSPNIITSCVAVLHDPTVTIIQMTSKLETAGFEISSLSSNNAVDVPGQPSRREWQPPKGSTAGLGSYLSRARRAKKSQNTASDEEKTKAHLSNCEQCRKDAASGTHVAEGATLGIFRTRSDTSTSKRNLARATTTTTTLAYSPFTVNNGTSTGTDTPISWRATLAISGMTCAACSNTITSELEKQEWIVKVTVNLISNSGVVEYVGDEADVSRVIEAIEDLGYDAHLDQVSAISDEQKRETVRRRTAQIHIDGFYCSHCGDRAASGVTGFQHDIQIDSHPTWERPILQINYLPHAPSFTIRHILAAIEASDPAFKASIYHPPTLEERAKKLQAQHQKQILLRALLALIVAVPTFVIGIVYMSLIPGDNPGKMFLMSPWVSGINRAQISLFILATPVYFCAADVFHRRTIKEIWSLWRPGSQTPIARRLYRFGSMNMLISLGTTIAYISSIAQMIAAAVKGGHHMIHDNDFYFDSVVFLTLFLLLGRFLEAYSKSKTGSAVEALGKLRPATAILVEEIEARKTNDRVVNTDMLEFGDTVRVLHGASPPCDGEVLEGSTMFDEASLTGESRPIKKHIGDSVFSGTVNKGTPILVRVTGTAGHSMLDQIVKVVREGQTKRAPMEKVADTLVAYFVPVITLIAIITWITWLVVGLADQKLEIMDPVPFSLQFAIAVFVVACPCGLALAAPTAIFVGGGLAAKHGILVKGGGEAFETASRINCVVFDKTGTLTMGGEPTVTDAETYVNEENVEGKECPRLFGALRAVEENSSHPIAKAVVSYCRTAGSDSMAVNNVEEIPGRGLKALASCISDDVQNGESFDIIVGNEALMRDFAVEIPPAVSMSLQKWKSEAKSIALVATTATTASFKLSSQNYSEANHSNSSNNNTYKLAAALSISDPIRPEAPAVIHALRRRGCDVWMLSGDNAVTAQAVALRVGIPADNVIAEVLPAQKFEKIKYLQSVLKVRRFHRQRRRWRGKGVATEVEEEDTSRRATVAMVGDGINDAPALTTADAGIAVGSGSDVAISSADFVLVGGGGSSGNSIASIVTLLDLSRVVFRRIRFNFAWALVYNVIAVPVAAGCLYPVTVGGAHVTLDPVWASLAMALSSFSVVLSSLALKTRIPGIGFRARSLERMDTGEMDL